MSPDETRRQQGVRNMMADLTALFGTVAMIVMFIHLLALGAPAYAPAVGLVFVISYWVTMRFMVTRLENHNLELQEQAQPNDPNHPRFGLH